LVELIEVSGSCHCGSIAYAAKIDPNRIQICHCRDCQRLTGTAFRTTAPASPESFILLKGEPRIYYKVANSGSRRGHAFCGTCGTPVFRLPTDNNPNYSLRVGGLDQAAELGRPGRQIWTKRRLPWTIDLASIAAFETQT
jgi:hypothetical protein